MVASKSRHRNPTLDPASISARKGKTKKTNLAEKSKFLRNATSDLGPSFELIHNPMNQDLICSSLIKTN